MIDAMMIRILSLVLALAAVAMPAHAQGAAERLQTVLSGVPLAALDGGQGAIVAGFGNGDAVRWIAVRGAQNGDNPDTPNRFAALRSAAPNQQAVIAAASDEAIRAATGLTPLDWVETWEVSQGPVRMGAMDIFPDSEMRLRGALFSRGFVQEDRGGVPVFWLGETDHVASEVVAPADPFGGEDGLPLRMAFTDNKAVWATGWGTLNSILSPAGETLATRHDAGAVIAGLQRLGNLGALASVRAWLRNGATVPVTGAEDGPVEALALADYSVGEREGAAMVLVLADGIDTTALAQRLTDAWPILSDLTSLATPIITASGNTITITLESDWGDDGAATNGGYEVFRSALSGGRLGFLIRR